MNEALQRVNKIGEDYGGVFTILGAIAGGIVVFAMVRRLF